MAVGNKISNEGFWLTDDESGHCFDVSLATELKNFFNSIKCDNVLDLGCGPGYYTKYFIDNNIKCEGWDGNPNTPMMSKGLCKVADLTQLNKFDNKDWVLSLEVGEHIPKEHEATFIQNLISHSKKGIILSWATPGQPGDGHVNCQSNEYVVNLMKSHNYILDTHSTIQLRNSAELWWFKNTIMVFRKKEMEKITFCIPSKSNLRYLKTCIPSIRENAFRKDHDIIVFVDQDNDGTVEWLEQVKDEYNIIYYVNPYLGEKLFGIGKGYDYCIEKSTTDVFMIFHADMMLGKDADLYAYNCLKSKTAVCSTRIEPPLHPNGGEKILLDFGVWPEEFKKDEFNKYVESQIKETKITNGIFAPWMLFKDEFLAIGGHDPILKSAREDSDVFNRLKLAGFTFIQPWNSLVYHLTGRGGQFQHGKITQEHSQKSEEWQKLMNNSTLEFIRKWGSSVKHTPLMEPIISPKYNIAYVVKNCNSQLLEVLEPWCDRIYIKDDMNILTDSYIEQEQPNTSFDLTKRILCIGHNDPIGENDIIVEFDATQLTQQSFQLLQQLPDIIKESGEIGEFELEIFKIKIQNIWEYQNDLVYLNK
jgi:glycosyltransferase involved in cell wall biosynthesis/2-polyprenyl-3-methyl-5-hydroxy-6-metoxy-1,4-benzoquinol methylase